MENATKGLMIAGAILIAIVLISMGVFLISQAQGFLTQGGSQFNDMEKSSFNSPIEQYEGVQNGANVKALLTKLNTINLQLTDNDVHLEQGIGINVTDGTNTLDIASKTEYKDAQAKLLGACRAKINTGKKYDVALDYDASTGLVSLVTITVK